jgi:single-stranded DNA-binding protein
MLEVLISGRLIRDPATRTGPSGKPFTTALLRVQTDGNDGEALVASCIAFGETGERLGRLRAGDAASLAGSAKLSEWQKEGQTRHGLDVTVRAVLSVQDARRRREQRGPFRRNRVEPGRNRRNPSAATGTAGPRQPNRQRSHRAKARTGRGLGRLRPRRRWGAVR